MQSFFLKREFVDTKVERFTLQSRMRLQGLASRRQTTASRSGFTLIEILVVVTIIGILVAIAMVSYSSINKQSRDARRKSDVEQLRSSFEMYRADKSTYPELWTDWVSTSDTAFASSLSPYLAPLPVDPIEGSYWYYPTQCIGSGATKKCYGYCVLSSMEKSANAVNYCTDTLPALPSVPLDRTTSLSKNP